MKKVLILALLIVLFAGIVMAADLPPAIQKINEYNQQQANLFFEKISIFVAFLAGMLSFLAPCTLAIVPVYFSATFKEKKKALPMTIAFFLGFALTFIALGVIASAIGQTFSSLQLKYDYLVIIAGVALLILGFMSVFNKGFLLVKTQMPKNKNFFGVFLTGVFFAFGWSACVGPILSGILLIASLVSYTKAALLMLFYALGNFIPFIIFSLLIDKYNLLENKWISGKEFKLKLLGKEHLFHTTTLISGILLIGMGTLFLVFGNTNIINRIDIFGLKFVEEGLQRSLLEFKYSWAIALLVLVLLSLFIWLIRRQKHEQV